MYEGTMYEDDSDNFNDLVRNIVVEKYLVPNAERASRATNGTTTKLHWAAHYGSLKQIVQAHKDIEARDSYGRTPFLRAVVAGQYEAAVLLLKCQADIDAKDNWHRTALHIAANKNDVEFVCFLLKMCADIEARDNIGRTPLHLAVNYRNIEAVHLLVRWGADVKVEDESGKTPLDIAETKGYEDIQEYLNNIYDDG